MSYLRVSDVTKAGEGVVMKVPARSYLTYGVAVVGVSALVAAPITPPPPDVIRDVRLAAASTNSAVPTPNQLLAALRNAASSAAAADPQQAAAIGGVVSEVLDFIVALNEATGESREVIAQALLDLPGGVLALAEVVIANPDLLPNAVSTLIHGLVGTLEEALAPIIEVLVTLPPPIGPAPGDPGIVLTASLALGNFLDGLLGQLPAPLPVMKLGAAVQSGLAAGPSAASVIGAVGDVVDFILALNEATGEAREVIAQALLDLPGGILALAQVVIEDPDLLPNALSTLIYGGVGTLQEALEPIIAVLVTLPPPIGPDSSTGDLGIVLTASLALNNVLTGLLGQLPEPLPDIATAAALPGGSTAGSIIGAVIDVVRFVIAINEATDEAREVIAQALLDLPGGILALAQVVIEDPSLLPNAVSTLIHDGVGTLEDALEPIIDVLITLPPPIGPSADDIGIVLRASLALSEVLDGFLDQLPDPLPVMLVGAAAKAGVADAVPAPVGGVVSDVLDFIAALSAATGESAAVIAEAIADLPGGILSLSRVVIDDPSLLPNAASTLIRGGVDTLEDALEPLVEVLATLPPPIGSSPEDPGIVLKASLALSEALDGLVDKLPPPLGAAASTKLAVDTDEGGAEDARTGAVERLRGVFGGGSTAETTDEEGTPDGVADDTGDGSGTPETVGADESDPGVPPQKRRPSLRLNILKDNPLASETTADGNDEAANDSDSNDSVRNFPTHRPSIGKVSVRDVIKRVTGNDSSDSDDNDDDAAAG